ncbi:unnamed protein product [Blepharisma stoltei]|uniref:Uncharacterized protein n=1 Tax=Blepharisma stoltei TaxID=1481888 RepID=A0AAU9JY13_9CILI|nr:unnamed protein product [Blepharisma stoltei]
MALELSQRIVKDWWHRMSRKDIKILLVQICAKGREESKKSLYSSFIIALEANTRDRYAFEESQTAIWRCSSYFWGGYCMKGPKR